jgi:DNA methylase
MRGNSPPGTNGDGQLCVAVPSKAYDEGEARSGVRWTVLKGDVRAVLPEFPEDRFSCVVTSPPYFWQRDYEEDQQIGLEPTIGGYVTALADVMDQVFRVLAKDGLLFLNLGDTYYSRKGEPKGNDRKNWARRFGVRAVDVKGLGVARKTAIGIPWRGALEMIDRGWTLRRDRQAVHQEFSWMESFHLLADIIIFLDMLSQRPLSRVVPDLDQLLAEPASFLSTRTK